MSGVEISMLWSLVLPLAVLSSNESEQIKINKPCTQ